MEGGRGKGVCLLILRLVDVQKNRENSKHTQTHTHKLVCFGRVPCTGSVVFLGTGIGINENTACFFPFPNYVLTHMAAPWSRGEARATCFARPAQDRYRCNREGFPVEARVMRVTIGPRWGLEKSIVSFCGSIFGVAFLLFRNRVQSLHHDILLNRCDVCRAPTLNRLHSTARRGHSGPCQFLYSALPSSLCYPLPHFSFAIPFFSALYRRRCRFSFIFSFADILLLLLPVFIFSLW